MHVNRIVPIFLLALGLPVFWLLVTTGPWQGSGDGLTFWVTGKALLLGLNPYDQGQLSSLWQSLGLQSYANGPNPALYPPWVLPLFLLLQYLPLNWLGPVLGFSSLLCLAASMYVALRYFSRQPLFLPDFAWFFVSLGIFFPAIVLFNLGQVSALVLLGVALFQLAACEERFSGRAGRCLAGIGFGLLLLKPHLVIPVFSFICARAFAKRDFSGLAWGVLLVALSLSSVLPFRSDILSLWVAAFPQTSRYSEALFSPNLRSILHAWLGCDVRQAIILCALIGLLSPIVFYRRLSALPLQHSIYVLLLPLGLVVSPHCWTYDFILCLPALVFIVAQLLSLRGTVFWRKAQLALVGVIAMQLLLVAGPEDMRYDWWYPLVILLYPIIIRFVSNKAAVVGL